VILEFRFVDADWIMFMRVDAELQFKYSVMTDSLYIPWYDFLSRSKYIVTLFGNLYELVVVDRVLFGIEQCRNTSSLQFSYQFIQMMTFFRLIFGYILPAAVNTFPRCCNDDKVKINIYIIFFVIYVMKVHDILDRKST